MSGTIDPDIPADDFPTPRYRPIPCYKPVMESIINTMTR